jgi:hypothetical protein
MSANTFPVTFNTYLLGQLVADSMAERWGDVTRETATRTAKRIKGANIVGLGGGVRTMNFTTKYEHASLAAADTWVLALETNISFDPKTLVFNDTVNVSEKSYANAVCKGYKARQLGPDDGIIEIDWRFEVPAVEQGTI